MSLAQEMPPRGGPHQDAVRMAELALQQALKPAGGAITAATETQIQNALYVLRCSRSDPAALARFERIATDLRLINEAKREGRPNFCASRLLRLRRIVFA